MKLSNCIEIISGGTPSTSKSDFWDGDIPWISIKDFNNSFKYIYKTEKSITKQGLEKSSTNMLYKNDIIISARGTVGCLAQIYYPMAFNQSCYGIRTINKDLMQNYLYYWLIANIDKFKKQTHGAVFDTITKSTFDNIEINYPSLVMQQHIVDTVGSLDTKIENNNKIIERLIIWKANNYKNTLSNIPCQEYNLLDMVDFIGGTQPPKSEHIYDYKQGYIRFIQNRDYSSENHLTYIKESTKNKLCNEYDIMMDKYGEAGKVRFGISGAYNVALAKIEPKNKVYQEWIREFLNTQEIQQYLFNSSIASTRASVSENNLMNIKIPVPSKNYIAKFEEKHKIVIEFILKLKQENKQLEKLKKLYLSYYF